LINSIKQNYECGKNIATALATQNPSSQNHGSQLWQKAKPLILKQRKLKIDNTKLNSKLALISIKNGNNSTTTTSHKHMLPSGQDVPKA
jgi:hypothetical protein